MPVLLSILLLLSCAAPGWGDDFSIVPSITVKEEYNTNILLAASDMKDDFITTISPGLEIVDHTGRFDGDLLVRFDRLEYAENQGLSATNKTYSGRLRYLVTPLLGISAEASYVRLPNPALVTGSTGIVTTKSPWDRITSSLSADYRLTEKAAAQLSYSYARDHFENATSSNDTSHNLNAGLEYDLSEYFPSVKGRLNAGYGHYFSSTSRTDNIAGTVGFSRQIDELWSVSADIGPIYVRSTVLVGQLVPDFLDIDGLEIPVGYHVVTEQRTNSGWGWWGKASLNYGGEYVNGALAYTRSLSTSTGYNGAAESNAVTLSAQYRLASELSALFSSSYYTLKSDPSRFSSQVINQKTLVVSPSLRYEFSKDMAMELSYEYTKVDYPASNTSANRQVISLRLLFQSPLFH
ncbi:MAG TPA: hypothetical protein VFG09_00175 [Thermodesulfovibrionales bacterium]|nr:hypothetical protein [Thermodesulfovibrionales bacterium]